MDPLTNAAAEVLKLGLPGAIIIGGCVLVWRLLGRVDELQNKRVEDTKQVTAALTESTKAIEASTESRDAHTRVMDRFNQSATDMLEQLRRRQ